MICSGGLQYGSVRRHLILEVPGLGTTPPPEASILTGNGEFTLPGFTGSAVSSLKITVNHYIALKTLVLNDYAGSLVDILDMKMV
jgi:hypothetical protein